MFKVRYLSTGSILCVAVCLLIGFMLGKLSDLESTLSLADTFKSAQLAYLSDRFTTAYQSQPTPIAIWEGTNLVSFCEKNSKRVIPVENCAQLAVLHSRLYALFVEQHQLNEATNEAIRTLELIKSISTNLPDVSPEQAVTNLLKRDSVKRTSFLEK
jgi:hypothetical protein